MACAAIYEDAEGLALDSSDAGSPDERLEDILSEEDDSLKELGKTFKGREKLFLSRLLSTPPMPHEEQLAYLREIKKGDSIARNVFIESNLKLVAKISYKLIRRFPQLYLDIFELINEGALGLERAVELFEESEGAAFSTYATDWIKSYLQKFVAKQGRALSIPPRYYNGPVREVKKACEEFFGEKQRQPSFEELSSRTGLSLKQVIRAYQLSQLPVSYCPDAHGGQNKTDFDPLSGEYLEQFIETRNEVLRYLNEFLSPREADVLRKWYGIAEPAPMTQQQIAGSYGVTKERIGQIAKMAIEKLESKGDKARLKNLLADLASLREKIYW